MVISNKGAFTLQRQNSYSQSNASNLQQILAQRQNRLEVFRSLLRFRDPAFPFPDVFDGLQSVFGAAAKRDELRDRISLLLGVRAAKTNVAFGQRSISQIETVMFGERKRNGVFLWGRRRSSSFALVATSTGQLNDAVASSSRLWTKILRAGASQTQQPSVP